MNSKTLATNRRAKYEYTLLKTMEAGIELQGTEVKSIREGKVSLSESYCRIDEQMQAYLLNAHIAHYHFGNRQNHDPLRKRKLLLHSGEIRRLYGQVKQQGLTLIPMRIYLKKGWIKVEIGLGKGKKMYDKRETMKRRDALRDVEQAMKTT